MHIYYESGVLKQTRFENYSGAFELVYPSQLSGDEGIKPEDIVGRMPVAVVNKKDWKARGLDSNSAQTPPVSELVSDIYHQLTFRDKKDILVLARQIYPEDKIRTLEQSLNFI